MKDRNIILYDPVKAFAPLSPYFGDLEMKAIPTDAFTGDHAEVAACFVGFDETLRRPLFSWRRHRRYRASGIPVVTWNRDAPHYLNRPRWRIDLLDRLRLFDIYATHTTIDTKRRFGEEALYLPNAAEPGLYHLGGDQDAVFSRLRRDETYEWDVSFFGAMDGKRFKEMRPRAEFFAVLADRLRQLGIRFLFREAGDMTAVDQVAFIQRSRINMNFGASCEYGASIASGLPERCYGIPAAGGFLLCDRRTHARDDFTPGLDWAEFDSLDDCVDKIRHWLSHFPAARDLAERCHHHVMACHTYRHRAGRIIAAINAWHHARPMACAGNGRAGPNPELEQTP